MLTVGMKSTWTIAVAGGCATTLAGAAALALYRRLSQARIAHESAVAAMQSRSSTVDRLLEFSQTIQAAGKPEQIFDALTLFLHGERDPICPQTGSKPAPGNGMFSANAVPVGFVRIFVVPRIMRFSSWRKSLWPPAPTF